MREKSNWEDEGGGECFKRVTEVGFNTEWGRNEAWVGFDGEICGRTGEKIGRLEGIRGKNSGSGGMGDGGGRY